MSGLACCCVKSIMICTAKIMLRFFQEPLCSPHLPSKHAMVLEIAFAQHAVTQSPVSASKVKYVHLKGIIVTPRDLPGQQLPQNNAK